MEERVQGKLAEVIDVEGKPFGFVLKSQHIHTVPSEKLFPGDDRWDWEFEVMSLYFTTFHESFMNLVSHAAIGDELTVTFVLRSKKYAAAWATFMNPRIIVNPKAKDALYSRAEIVGVI